MIIMAQMRRFELLIARGRIGLLSALGLKADALLCSRASNKRRPLCHICSYFSRPRSYYYMLIAIRRSIVMIFALFLNYFKWTYRKVRWQLVELHRKANFTFISINTKILFYDWMVILPFCKLYLSNINY